MEFLLFQIHSFQTKYIIVMHKSPQIKTRKHLKEFNRFQAKAPKNGEKHAYDTSSANYCINIKSEKPRKSSEKLHTDGRKLAKDKKLKFITEQIEKSTHEPSFNRTKSCYKECSTKTATYNVEEDNAYEGPSKRQQKTQADEVKAVGNNLNLGRVKSRKGKSSSKQHGFLLRHQIPKNVQKGHKKTKIQTKSALKTQKLHRSRQYLSPQIVKHENSYYFSEEPVRKAQTIHLIPKKESKYIFESSRSYWQEQPPKKIVNSFLDLLN